VASHRAGNCSTCSFLFSFPIRFDHSTPRPNHPKKSPPSTQKKQKANKQQKKEKRKKKAGTASVHMDTCRLSGPALT
jgi:hypothetical protein